MPKQKVAGKLEDYIKPGDNIFGAKKLKIVRHVGDLQSATLDDGKTVHRSERIYLKYLDALVTCAGYDNHFIFRHEFSNRGWTTWCTCSSPAVVSGYSGYSKDASPSGQLLICLHHAMYNRHMDGSS